MNFEEATLGISSVVRKVVEQLFSLQLAEGGVFIELPSPVLELGQPIFLLVDIASPIFQQRIDLDPSPFGRLRGFRSFLILGGLVIQADGRRLAQPVPGRAERALGRAHGHGRVPLFLPGRFRLPT